VTSKDEVRGDISRARRARGEPERERARVEIRRWALQGLAALALPAGARVACYEPLASEPGSIELLVELHRAGYEVIVPITQQDKDLDWAVWTLTRQARRPLGLSAIATASVVFVPAFAVDRQGHRLGRGGGSYDRALTRVRPQTPLVALLFDGELIDDVPVADWDLPVTAVITPQGWQEVGPGGTPEQAMKHHC
jgi:5-formyltetrahydrofolate cyclo-ligase